MTKIKWLLSALFALSFVVLGLSSQHLKAADTDNFTINTFDARYHLWRDDNNVDNLETQEVITAKFPDYDQNHGILRAIPKSYDEHPVDLKIQSVKDGNDAELPYSTYESGGNLVVKIGDADKYVHGVQTYIIKYTQQNVIKKFADHDEWYWDVNGDQWNQVAKNVTAQITIDKELQDSLKPEYYCYTGSYGSTESACIISGSDGQYSAVANRPMQAGETLTFVLGFNKDTFAGYSMPISQLIGTILIVVFLFVLPILLSLLIVWRKWYKYGRDPKGRGTIVPMYLPPKDASVLSCDVVLNESFNTRAVSAQIIDLAVRHYLKIIEVEEKGFIKKKRSYEVEIVKDWSDLRTEEQDVIKLLFGNNPQIGDVKSIKSLDKKIYKEVEKIKQKVVDLAVAGGYFTRDPEKVKRPYLITGSILLVISFFAMPFTLGIMATAIIFMIGSLVMPARSAKGVSLREHLLGLKMYMKVAEAERIKILQSPNGKLTEKITIDPNDKKQLVKLYERLLPYAMLFGIEEDWAKQFATLYQDQNPDWYLGHGAFQPVLFATAMHSFGAATTASFSPPSSSSSSGMGGGGFSGGGGGGGGGGGW